MQGKLFLGDLVGNAAKILLARQSARQLSSTAANSAFISRDNLRPLDQESSEGKNLPNEKMGKMRKELRVYRAGKNPEKGIPEETVFLVKAPGQPNTDLDKEDSTKKVTKKKNAHVHNPLSRAERLNADLMKKALAPHKELDVANVFLVASKNNDSKIDEQTRRDFGNQNLFVAAEVMNLESFPTRENCKEHAADMTEAITRDGGDAFAKTFMPAALILSTDHPGPDLTNIGMSKEGKIAMFDFDVGGNNTNLKGLFTKEMLVRSVDEMRGIKDTKVFEDSTSKLVQQNLDAGRSMYATEGNASIPANHVSREFYKRYVSSSDVLLGINLTKTQIEESVNSTFAQSPLEFKDPTKQRDFLKASNSALRRGHELGEIIVGRLAQAHALVEATRQLLPDNEEGLFPSAEAVMQRHKDLDKELRRANKDELPAETKEAIRQELIKDAGMEHLDLEFRETRKQKRMEMEQNSKKKNFASSIKEEKEERKEGRLF